MIKRLSAVLLVSSLIFSFATFGIVVGQEEPPADDTQQTTQDRRDQIKNNYQQKVERLTSAREAKLTNRCSNIEDKIVQLTDRVNTVKEARGNLLVNLISKLENISTKLGNNGLDVTMLSADIDTLKTYSDELSDSWAVYLTTVENLKNVQCDKDVAEFHEALEITKLAFADVKAKYKEAKNFIGTEIKADLQALREQFKKTDESGAENS